MTSRVDSRSVDSLAGLLFIVGLAVWYAGADSLDAQLVAAPVAIVTAVCAAVALGVGAALARAGGARHAFGTGAVLAVGAAMIAAGGFSLVNRLLDRSQGVAHAARVLGTRVGSKGPRRIALELDGARVETFASRAPTCGTSGPAVVHVRRGALGVPWISSLVCAGAAP